MATTAMTARQRGKIFAMAKTLCVGDDELHDIVRGLTGCDSIRELSGKQAIRVIDRLNVLAGVTKDVPNRASEAQQLYILRLAREMGWAGEPSRLRGFLEAEGPLGGQLDLGDGEFRHGHAVGHPRAEHAHIAVEKRLGKGLYGAGGVEDSLQ